MNWYSKLAALGALVAGMIGWHKATRRKQNNRLSTQVSWKPKEDKRLPAEGTKRVRTRFAWRPVVDEDGVARWMEYVVVEEYWTYGYGKGGTFRWYWAVSRVVGTPDISSY